METEKPVIRTEAGMYVLSHVLTDPVLQPAGIAEAIRLGIEGVPLDLEDVDKTENIDIHVVRHGVIKADKRSLEEFGSRIIGAGAHLVVMHFDHAPTDQRHVVLQMYREGPESPMEIDIARRPRRKDEQLLDGSSWTRVSQSGPADAPSYWIREGTVLRGERGNTSVHMPPARHFPREIAWEVGIGDVVDDIVPVAACTTETRIDHDSGRYELRHDPVRIESYRDSGSANLILAEALATEFADDLAFLLERRDRIAVSVTTGEAEPRNPQEAAERMSYQFMARAMGEIARFNEKRAGSVKIVR